MKFKILYLLFFISLSSFAQDMPAYKIFNNKGEEVAYNIMLKSIENAEFVFFGELHDNPIAHWLEFNLAQDLYKSKKDNLIIGMEMFESDNQIIIDEYMNNIISMKKFEAECRLWNNYKTDYKPIVEFAKNKKIPFIATNVPRRYANVVFKKDFKGLDSISKQAKKFIAPLPITFDPTVDCYKKMMHMGMPGLGQNANHKIAKAQALKDATMAFFILNNWQPGKIFYHINGDYHSKNHQGICWYLYKENKDFKIITISTVLQKDLTNLKPKYHDNADFIICVSENMTSTY